ncbi:MAG: arylsulfatase [Rikenellaceae bacterium]
MKRDLITGAIVLPAIIAGSTACGGSTNGAKSKLPTQKPNIVFVLADDMGIGDLGCYGQKDIKTPTIDALAESGLLFTHHYSGSTVSAPSRCCLLTGKHTGNAYIRGNKGEAVNGGSYDKALPADEVTIAKLLKEQGYATGCVGKWGLGGPNTTGSPTNQGFDYFYGYLSQGAAHRYYPNHLFENDEKVMLDGKTYSHTLIKDKGLDFIRENSDGPFFAYFAITLPHADLDYPDISQYDGKFEETPYINKSGKGFITQMKPRATYAAMVTGVDQCVAEIVELLKAEGVYDNTIIIVSSDNGVHDVGGHDPEAFDSNLDFRGWKRDLYDGGVRTPFIVSWPAVIKGGRTTDHESTFWDFLPTVCELTGAEAPSSIDGISYLPTLLDDETNQAKHDYIYYEFYERGGRQMIFKDGWKLVRLNKSKPKQYVEELYFTPNDISEAKNVIGENPEKAAELGRLMDGARSESEIFKW